MEFPDRKGYIEFYMYISNKNSKSTKSNAYTKYKRAKSEFNTVKELLDCYSFKEKGLSLDSVIIYFSLKYKIKAPDLVPFIRVNKAERIIRLFNPNKEKFFELYRELISKEKKASRYFFPLLVKMMVFYGKSDIDDITHEDIKGLYDKRFLKSSVHSKYFIDKMDILYGFYTGKGQTTILSRINKQKSYVQVYGIEHEDIVYYLKKYLKEEYELKGYQIFNPLKSIKTFFKWINEKYTNCNTICKITREHWLEYKKMIESKGYAKRTEKGKINDIANLFRWLQTNEYVGCEVVEYNERAKISSQEVKEDTKPRMFNCREDFKKVLATVYLYNPTNEKEELIKHLILIATATGMRLNELIWLGPDCIINEKDGVGEITVKINEKLNIRNKITSILPWGIESIKFLEDRFKNRRYIEFYHKKTNQYLPILFEYNGKPLSINVASVEFNKILDKIDFYDDNGNEIDYSGVSYHGFRHQKFNDIFQVTGGQLTAVKMDSNHKTLEMVRRYTKQDERKRQIEAYRLLEEGKIVGKGAEILSTLLESPYTPEEYMNIVSKMNIAGNITIRGIKTAIKYLGFGYCTAKQCKIKPVCEECDYFWTCKTFKEDLMDRYAKNFILVKSRINDILGGSDDRSLITGLKYQEKWLSQIGVSDDTINYLRIKYIEE